MYLNKEIKLIHNMLFGNNQTTIMVFCQKNADNINVKIVEKLGSLTFFNKVPTA